MPPSRVLDALKSPVKVGLSMRGLVQENLRGHFGSGKNDADEFFSCETLQFNTTSTGGGGECFPPLICFVPVTFLFLNQFPSNLELFLKFNTELGER